MLKGTEAIAHRTTQGNRAEAEADGRCRWQEASGHLAQAQIGTADTGAYAAWLIR